MNLIEFIKHFLFNMMYNKISNFIYIIIYDLFVLIFYLWKVPSVQLHLSTQPIVSF